MAVLNRKLFNRGGPVSSRGVGITSGLVPVQKFQEGGRVNRLEALSPALIDLGGRLLAGKSFQGGIGGGLDIVGQALSGSAPSFAEGLKTYRAGQQIADREIIKGADGYNYYVDTGERVLPDIVKQDETKKSERYRTWLDTDPTPENPPTNKDLETMGTFNEFLVKTEYIKPTKEPKRFWAVDKTTGNDLRVTEDEFNSNTMEKGKPDRQGEGDKFIDVYDEEENKMIRITNDEFNPKIHRRDPPKLEANDKYTNNYKDYLKSTDNPTPKGFVEFLDRNEKETKGPTSYEEYIRTTDNPTPEGYAEYLEKFELSQPSLTTDYNNYLKTLDDESEATGDGFAAFLDKKLQGKQADKDYWVWDKNEGNWDLIKGSEFDSSKHSKEPLNQAQFLTDDGEFSTLVENKVSMMQNDLASKINPATGLTYTNAEINKIVFEEVRKLVDQRLEALANEQPNVLGPEEELEKEANLKDLERRDNAINKWAETTESRGLNAGPKLQQFQMLGLAKEDAIIGKVFQPQREWVGSILNFLGWDKPENIEKMSDDMKEMIGGLQNFIGGNIASTDVVRAITNLGTLANAENGALPGNLNQAEFQTLKESYATLFNSKEGFSLIVDLYQRDAQIDQMRYEAWSNYLLTRKLEGRLFGDDSIDGDTISDGEAVAMIKERIQEARDGMVTGLDKYGWSDLSEQFDAVKSKGKLVSDWGKFDNISVRRNVEGVDETFSVNIQEAETDGRIRFLGYSDEDGQFTYDSQSGPQDVKIGVGPNKPVYEINTGKLDNRGQPIFVVKGFNVQ